MSAAARRKIVCCPECKRVMRSCVEIEEDDAEADPHLYLLTAVAGAREQEIHEQLRPFRVEGAISQA